ncbi:MAG TPA: glycoside hydrolase N-terminal domain-containing protein, partial [Flavitalea sp.]|nr:glycoside hydrolase N-terminal domain-containing protein [Flavitalea sp.]
MYSSHITANYRIPLISATEKCIKLILFILVILGNGLSVTGQAPLKLWYKQPAKEWVEALPLGNGRIGAMVFGGVENELIQLNESTLWSGGPVSASVNPDAYSHLAEIREALL